ncbi:hypothetical protein NDU88_004113 [Pleurodeles waltl]|uniref:Uncharacterized protein n=1 Tax=Pleurodeles waltl TaxID=8319 RepID=A0AAV7WUY6_PLEWA|nr:hypothetical protein NDU88_004113 [Pleurodeles waltl]
MSGYPRPLRAPGSAALPGGSTAPQKAAGKQRAAGWKERLRPGAFPYQGYPTLAAGAGRVCSLSSQRRSPSFGTPAQHHKITLWEGGGRTSALDREPGLKEREQALTS